MAIEFNQDISTTKLLMAYNNNIVLLKSTSALIALTCEITLFGKVAIIYPSPSGDFFFNIKDYVTAAINTKNFADDLVTDIDSGDASTFTYDVSDGCYIANVINFKIIFKDNSYETITKSLKFLAGAEQLETYKKNEMLIADSDYLVLSPVQNRSNNTVDLKFWSGYPFEFSFYTNFPDDDFKLKNTTNALDYTFTAKGDVTALYFGDGRTDVSIEDILPLDLGLNVLRIEHDATLMDPIINLTKMDSDCGVYIKWLNKYGRWNYWLFSEQHFRNRGSRYMAELDNDNDNLEDTISPTLQIGKTTQDTLKCFYKKLDQADKTVVDGLSEAIKIMLFVGERYSRSSVNDWIEVTIKSNSFVMRKPNTKFYEMEVDFELPIRYGQQL
ncbi:hypothetical protein [Flavobacterium sp. 25HG05S-40]|uniref:hypothetical protein n=1 Tax=Flavobacterium sp. 25HG05S-40 TaxID=3458682 RepID=UPI004044A65D